jgi:spermidine synthase
MQLHNEITMLPWIHLDTGQIPGGGNLRLKQRGSEFSIMLGANELMNSRLSGSEEALANLVAERLKDHQKPRILIGGLGMGFTLRAALAAFPAKAEIIVSELVPSVIAWARGPMAGLYESSLDDTRVTIAEEDVIERIRFDRAGFDAILLDVDNGPDGLTRASNDGLYDAAGLIKAHGALRAGGILAIWSAHPDDAFTKRLRRTGFQVEEISVRASRSKRGAKHVIWVATRSR